MLRGQVLPLAQNPKLDQQISKYSPDVYRYLLRSPVNAYYDPALVCKGNARTAPSIPISQGVERGKLFRPNLKLIPPFHLEPDVLDYLFKRAHAKGTSINALVNALPKKEIELIVVGRQARDFLLDHHNQPLSNPTQTPRLRGAFF